MHTKTRLVFFKSRCLTCRIREWELKGQVLLFTLLLTDQFSVITEISEATGMLARKEKLSHEGIFTNDSNLLAYFNTVNGAGIC